MTGDKCRLGAGCVNCASPVLGGFGDSIGKGSNMVTPQGRNPWQTVNTKRILNSKDSVLLARSNASGGLKWSTQWRCSVNAAVRRLTYITQYPDGNV